MTKPVYETGRIKPPEGDPGRVKRARRSQSEIAVVRNAVKLECRIQRQMTCRQLFYRLVSKSIIPKTELAYKALCRLLGQMRRDGSLSYRAIVDHTRWMRRPRTYSSLLSALESTKQAYRRCVWDDQDVYVEIWAEKSGLAGVLWEVTSEWDVPLMLCSGYPSISFVHSAAEAMAAEDKPTFLYYLGDHDPSGRDIDRFIEEQLRELAPEVDLTFERVAVTEEQIDELSLQTRPTKKTDSRSKGFVGESVEVDAIAPQTLREIVRECIEKHIDHEQHRKLLKTEKNERESLEKIILRLEEEDAA